MLLSTTGRTAWIILNVVAAAAFLHLASWSWLEPNLRGEEVARSGDAVVWAVTAFPVLVSAGFGNIVWLSFAIRERRRQIQPSPLPTITVLAAVWMSALVVNWLRLNGF